MKELTSHLQELLMYPADHLFDDNEPIIWTDDKILDWASRMDSELIKGKKYIIFSYDEKLKDNEFNGYSKLETSREIIRGFKTEQECKRVLNQEKKDNKDIDLFCIQVDALTLKDKENPSSKGWDF